MFGHGCAPGGYCAWRQQPGSARARDDRRLLGLLKPAWLESGCVYGYRKLTLDLGETCGKQRVVRLLRQEEIRSQKAYRRRSGGCGGKPAMVVPNHLDRQFMSERPNLSWVPDITYKRRHNTAGNVPPVEFEKRHSQRLGNVY